MQLLNDYKKETLPIKKEIEKKIAGKLISVQRYKDG